MCNQTWFRLRSRGRKPRFCLKCVKANMIDINKSNEQIFEEDEKIDLQEEVKIINEKLDPKNKVVWTCPKCNLVLITYVPLSCVPTCNNPDSHSSKHIEMQKYTRKDEKIAIYA